MNYLYLIRQLFLYDKYLKYRHHIKIEKDQKEIYYLFKALDQLMEKFQKNISFEDYALWVQVNLGNDYTQYIQLLKETSTDETILEASLNEIKTRSILYELANAALAGSEGKKSVEQVLQLVETLTQDAKTTDVQSPFISTSLSELYDDAYKHHGLRWRLDSLNKSLGSLRRGDFGFIFARPESGKTTFLASECSYFAEQLEEDSPPGIWFNNEEQHNKVMLRIYQASLGITIGELAKDIKGYEQLYKEKTKDKILIPNLDIIHRKEVEAILRDVRPSFIIFDQLSKIKGFTNDRDDLRLGATFEWARELAKEYAPVIGVNQADASGEGKKYLNMDNVAGAKTAIQAEADWILGIGKTNDAGFEYIRHFNICKNKLIGDEDTDPARRHGKIDCLIQADIARYRDL